MALRVSLKTASSAIFGISAAVFAASMVTAQAGEQPPMPVDQGSAWTDAKRAQFYTGNQGSELIPLAWARALPGPGGTSFLADGLRRYGYLSNPFGHDGLPIGFTVDTRDGTDHLGMTCAACHTRELLVDGQRYRIDGAPALTDFQGFLSDLRLAVRDVLASPASFGQFATRVLGAQATPDQITALHDSVSRWDQRQGAFFDAVLPASAPWGVGRLDAVSMIFDRISGLDIGNTPQDAAASLYVADAPVRYPFIWDAPRQDRTQWPGFAANGDNFYGLTRNLGEVYGVFADFEVKPALIGRRYLQQNSAKIDNLIMLERLVDDIGAPKWRWPIDQAAADRGQAIFQGKCSGCHAERPGEARLIPNRPTWATRLEDVNTDQHQYDVLARSAATGVLHGELLPPIGRNERQFTLLQTVVIHSLTDYFFNNPSAFQKLFPDATPAALRQTMTTPGTRAEVKQAYQMATLDTATAAPRPGRYKYEARVLHGIWAAAPYLHNGSVRSLAQLLTPEEARDPSFEVGPAFDAAAVGLAKTQPNPQAVRVTTGCTDRRSGNSRCGHSGPAYGTDLTPGQKADLLEYLKIL